MLPSNLNLSIGKTKGYNKKILVSNTDMKIGSDRDINKGRKKLSVAKPDMLKKIVISAVQHDPPHNLKMLTEKRNDEKLTITLNCRDWFNCLSLLVENKWHHYYSQ